MTAYLPPEKIAGGDREASYKLFVLGPEPGRAGPVRWNRWGFWILIES